LTARSGLCTLRCVRANITSVVWRSVGCWLLTFSCGTIVRGREWRREQHGLAILQQRQAPTSGVRPRTELTYRITPTRIAARGREKAGGETAVWLCCQGIQDQTRSSCQRLTQDPRRPHGDVRRPQRASVQGVERGAVSRRSWAGACFFFSVYHSLGELLSSCENTRDLPALRLPAGGGRPCTDTTV
jgi:hypothetical protein